jgi:hypothetical protein
MLNIKPLNPEIKKEEKVNHPLKDRHGNLVYSDPIFDAIIKVIKEDINAIRNGVLYSQYGTKLSFFQGNPSNHWGFIEVINGDKVSDKIKPEYRIRIYSSILKKIFKKNELTKEFFEGVI